MGSHFRDHSMYVRKAEHGFLHFWPATKDISLQTAKILGEFIQVFYSESLVEVTVKYLVAFLPLKKKCLVTLYLGQFGTNNASCQFH